jgi:phosphatidylglycerophosphate synthase
MANLITFLRIPLLFCYVGILYYGDAIITFWCVPLLILIFLMDSADGYVARLRGETSLLGSAFDIATDRTLEVVLWVVYSHLGLVPIVIPLIAIVRGTTVDAVRAVGMSKGVVAFEQVNNPVSRFLVSSRFMRSTYGVIKAVAFVLLNVVLGLNKQSSSGASIVHTIAMTTSWAAISLTVLRGLPPLIEGYKYFSNNNKSE